MKDRVLSDLRELRSGLSDLLTTIRQGDSQLVNPATVSERVACLCRLWSEKLEPKLSQFAVDDDCQEKYHSGLEQLFKLAARRNRAKSYRSLCRNLLKHFDEDLSSPVLFAHLDAPTDPRLESLIAAVPYADQKGYLDEALRCLKVDGKRAATVLGWCAAMHQIHCKIEEMGFDLFNTKATDLASQKKGRFKSFDGIAPINSISDLRETPDRKVLIVIDGMNLIESNQ